MSDRDIDQIGNFLAGHRTGQIDELLHIVVRYLVRRGYTRSEIEAAVDRVLDDE